MRISLALDVPRRARRAAIAARLVSGALAPLAVLTPLACGSPVEMADLRSITGTTEIELFGGLVQRITVTPAEPTIGEEVEIRSVVRNAGTGTPRFLTNTCRLDLESALELATAPDWTECDALPHQVDLFPGDSVEVRTRQRVHGVAGEHEIRVLHVLEPQQWVPVKVLLRPLS
jgi:hypothetical protein